MSLEHELLELNAAYQNSVAVAADLRERCQQLEQLVRDAQNHMELYRMAIENSTGLLHAVRIHRLPEIEMWQQRAKELLPLDEESEQEPESITITGDNPADYIL